MDFSQKRTRYVPPHKRKDGSDTNGNTPPPPPVSSSFHSQSDYIPNNNAPPPQDYNRRDISYDQRKKYGDRNEYQQNNTFRSNNYNQYRSVKNFENQNFNRTRDLEHELFHNQNEVTQGINFELYEKIPVECSGEDPPSPIESFDKSGLHEIILKNIGLCNYTKPTPIQKYAISCVLERRDLMACAQTGSGKTAAFLLPIIDQLIRYQERISPSSPSSLYSRACYPLALVLSPTRELSIQIHQQARKFLYKTGMRSVVVYGGADPRRQQSELERGAAVLVATPGRLNDFMERNTVSMKKILFLVLDEADRMLDMGFMPQIQQIVDESDMPKKTSRHTMMFSATFPMEIQKLAQHFLSDYIFLAVGRVGSTTEFITQQLKNVEDYDKMPELIELIRQCEGLKLIFVETRKDADRVENELHHKGFEVMAIHGDRTQRERERALELFRNGKVPILVATDVAARGLDIPNVMWVINYDLPNNIDSYVHRIGRTGRCGNNGTAISFINENNKPILKDLQKILRETKQEIPQWFAELQRKCFANKQKSYRTNYYGNSYGNSYGSSYGSFGGHDVRKNGKNYDQYNNNNTNNGNNGNTTSNSRFSYYTYNENYASNYNQQQNQNDQQHNQQPHTENYDENRVQSNWRDGW